MNTHGAGRYAPSPSGELHVGNLRTALAAWLFARASGRKFLMRIEDLDRDRDAGSADAQLADLALIGIDWDDAPVLQTERASVYEQALADLSARGLVYECTCTRKDILSAPSAPHTPPGAYPGTCRDRTEEERTAAREDILPRRPALRIRATQGVTSLSFEDRILGTVRGDIDDFVLRRGDGTIAYNFAVVVDDAAMGIDQIVRGDDLASSTPRQIFLQRQLELPSAPEVEYAHVPLVIAHTGARLAKRDGAVTLRQLRDAGVTGDDVRGMLARSLGIASPGENPGMGELTQRFDPALLPRSPWVWDGFEG